MSRKMQYRNGGFSLVELIVVIVIMLVLAAAMVPNVMKYIWKAQEAAAVSEAQEFVNASYLGLIDAFAQKPVDLKKTVKRSGCPKVSGTYGFITSNLLATRQGHGSSGTTDAKTVIAECILEHLYSEKGKTTKYYFSSKDITKGLDTKTLDKGEVAFVLLYDQKGVILLMQMAHDGIMVTYHNGAYTVEQDGTMTKF